MFSTQLPGGLYESIDPATSNIYVQIPVRNKNGKIPFSYKLALNSHAVVTEYCSHLGEYTWWVSPVANNSCNASPSGGNFSGSQPFGVKVPDPTSAPATVNCNGIKYQYNVWTNFSIVDATGVTHSVPGMRIYTNYPKACTNPVPTATGVTTDGSGFSLVASADTAPWATVYDKSGNEIQPQTGDAAIVTDPDGTTLTAAVTNTAFAYTDALDATVPVLAIPNQQGGWGVPAVYEYTDAAGNTQSLTVNSTPYTQQTAFGCSGIQDIPPVADTYLPSSIVTPAGTITLSYETTPGDTHNPHYVTGRLAGITYPTGASVSYAYSGGNSGIYCTVAYPNIVPTITKTINDENGNLSTWKYVNSNSTYQQNFGVTVTGPSPSQNQTVYSFYGQFQTQVQYYQGAASGTPLKTVVTCYNKTYSSLSACVTPGVLYLPVTQTDVYTSLAGC